MGGDYYGIERKIKARWIVLLFSKQLCLQKYSWFVHCQFSQIPVDQGWVLDGFPMTLNQARLLDEALTGCNRTLMELERKKAQKHALAVDPTATKEVPLPPVALDFVMLLDISDSSSLDRMNEVMGKLDASFYFFFFILFYFIFISFHFISFFDDLVYNLNSFKILSILKFIFLAQPIWSWCRLGPTKGSPFADANLK